MKKYRVITNCLTTCEQKDFQRYFPKHTIKKDVLEISEVSDRGNTCHLRHRAVIVDGPYTPAGCVRDCGDYYIRAKYDRYEKLVKFPGTNVIVKIIDDVEDK